MAGPDLTLRGDLDVVPRGLLDVPAPDAARLLLGAVLVRAGEVPVLARVVEVEAYDESDPASHTHRGRTPGNATMFGPAGHAYVYFTYGMHHCMNVVTGAEGHGAAVLLRAARVLDGHAVVRPRRPAARRDRELANGPAKLARALDVDRRHDGVDLCREGTDLWLARDDYRAPRGGVDHGPRVGVRLAADRAWRFWLRDVPEVSTYRRHPRAAPSSPGG